MLSGLAARADEPGFLSQIFGMITNPANSSSAVSALTSNPSAVLSGSSPLSDLAGRFLPMLFGSRLGGITDAIGQFTGVGSSKAGTLLSMAAPLVLGGLGKFVRDNSMTASGLASSLKSEAPKLQSLLPAGLSNLFSTVPPTAAAGCAGASSSGDDESLVMAGGDTRCSASGCAMVLQSFESSRQ